MYSGCEVNKTLFVPSILLALLVATGVSGCADGDSTTVPTAPSPASDPTKEPTSPVPPTNGLGLALTGISTAAVDQPVTFVVAASSSVDAGFDFGDGAQETFALEASVARAITHVYRQTGKFVATFTATAKAGESASAAITLVVR